MQAQPGSDLRFISGSHCVFRLWYHLIIVTKYRRAVLTPAMGARCDALVRAIVETNGGRLAEANGEADHRHFLLDLPPHCQPSRLVGAIKTATSRVLRREYPAEVRRWYRAKPVLWSRSYCLLSAGGAPLAVIRSYIENKGLHEHEF